MTTPEQPADDDRTPPADLAATVVAAATAARPSGALHPLGADPIDPVEGLWRTAMELYGTLTTLDDDQWPLLTATPYGSLHDLVAHVVGIERYTVAAIDGRHGSDAADGTRDADDHQSIGRAAIAELRHLTGPDLAATWLDAVGDTVQRLRDAAPDQAITIHGIPADPQLVAVFRTFEVWAHTEDVCRTIGAPLPRLDGPRLGLMASSLTSMLPLFFTDPTPAQVGRTVRLVLLGPGGGVVDLALDPAVDVTGAAPERPQPSARLVADVVDYCRVAARRLPVDQLEARITGDPDLVAPVLAATMAFAMD